MRADYHVHTIFSDDSEEPMENAVQKGIELNLEEICFTDHVDYGVKIDYDRYLELDEAEQQKVGTGINVNYPEYFRQINRLKEKYNGQIEIRRGLEFGIQTHTIHEFQKLFDQYPMDFVILSCHQVGDKEFWTNEFQKGKTADEYNALYYQEIHDCMSGYKDYSILGHLDVIQRYSKEIYPFEKSKEMIEKILKLAIRDEKGIEVNTSSFRYGVEDLTPAKAILELYHELGGEIITVGSDAHSADYLGDHIFEAAEELRRIGFKYHCTYEDMKPVFHDLKDFI